MKILSKGKQKFISSLLVAVLALSFSVQLPTMALTREEALTKEIAGDKDNGLLYPTVDTTNVGYNIQRTMHLLETSTAENPNTVKFVLYGQSIIQNGNDWTDWLHQYLQQKYPTANIEWHNIAIGGFSSDLLKLMVERDMKELYPDLVIFCDYGPYDGFVQVVRYLRTKTTSEFMFMTDHYTGNSGGIDNNAEQNSTVFIPQICNEYGCEITDVRTYYKQYCEMNKVEPSSYLMEDMVHLGDLGQVLMYRLMKQFFVYKAPEADSTALATVKCLTVGEGKDVNWNNGELVIPVQGNRFEVITGAGNDYEGLVYINEEKPSSNVDAYNYTRICDKEFWLMGGFLRGTLTNVPKVEDWNLTFTEADAQTSTFKYDLVGSITGADGSGGSDGVFHSNSGVWMLNPDEVFTSSVGYTDLDGTSKTGFYTVGNTFKFSTYLNGTDSFKSGEDNKKILLASGYDTVRNTLKIKAADATKIPDIKEVIVYAPPIYTGEVKKPNNLISLKDNTRWLAGTAQPDAEIVAIDESSSKVYVYETDLDGAFMFKINKVAAGNKIKVYSLFMNKESEVVTLTAKPRKPSIKKVTTKSKVITGKASPKAKATIKIGKAKKVVKVNAKGVYNLKITKKIKKYMRKNVKIQVTVNINGLKSKTATRKIKK